MNSIGKGLFVLAQIVGSVTWIGSSIWLFQNKGTGMGLLSLFVPPADLVLAFLTPWWPGLIAFVALMGLGALMMAPRTSAA